MVEDSNERKRKRGRKPKDKFLKDGNGVELLKVNQNGAVVDFAELGNADEFYTGALRRRTEGLGTEEEGLGFLRGLDGQWCSTRKKRKFVDASDFGDKFPVGWKLLLALRRRDGRVSVYCRRYISPTGEHFLSCKEASSFLKSHFEDSEKQLMDQRTGSDQPVYKVDFGSHAGFVDKDNSALPGSSISDTNDKVNLLGIENLTEVQIRDIFDCSKCNKTYDEKDEYLRHLLSVHKNTTRRYGLGTSVGGGVIIKDGKYECQFCHKVFQERRSYSGHVGVHVRNLVRNFEEWPTQVTTRKTNESSSHDGLPSRMSKMDALIEIAQNSIVENSNDRHIEKPSGGSYNLNMEEISAAVSDHEPSFSCHLSEMDNCMAVATLGPELKRSSDEHMITDEEVAKIDSLSPNTANYVNVVGTSTSDHLELDTVGNCGSCGLGVICGNNNVQPNEVITDTTKQIKDNILQNGITNSSMPSVQSLYYFPAFNATSNKGENGVSSADQKLDDVSGFKELQFDEIEPLRNSYVNGQQSVSLPEVSMELANHAVIGDSTTVVEPETIMLNIAARCQLTSVCVWCRNEFDHEAIDFEIMSDSIGFMCPTCKDAISGKLDGVCP